ncbi:alginate O-acetyltransferase AlgX-related protein [Phenylobacterium sp. VNQ135]|uniref:alginate O-acetyltransferase AlgX-related protein n=1 Tax=Phenylobacterium sp. VNQ135 TaxID=3400922 RepID=UPI003C0FF153
MARSLRAHWIGLMGASAAVLAAGFLAPRLAPAPDLAENRAPAPAPELKASWRALREYPQAADAWVADHFPARPHLIGGLNFLRAKLGVSGSEKVIVGRDGWLFFDNGTHLGSARNDPAYTDAQAGQWLAGLAGRTEALRARGATYLVVAAPDKETVYPELGPRWFKGPNLNRPAELLPALAASSQAGEVLYLHEALEQPTRWGLKTYTPNDTHWTGLGAYYGYAAVMRRLQALGVAEGPRPLDDFVEVRERDPNKPRNLALMLGVASFVNVDYPELADPAAEDRLRVTWLTPSQDWTQPRVIDTGQAGKPVLLMTMDSFSNAFLPFFYSHFSRIVLAHNQDGPWRDDLIERYQPDVVILEVVENGLPLVMAPAPEASLTARQRIAAALDLPHRVPAEYEVARVRPRGPMPTITGGPGPDLLRGGPRAEIILGRQGPDTVDGGDGDDIIRTGAGGDRIDAGPGADWISGDKGDDVLRGGRGPDIFVTRADVGTDHVLDFSAAEGDRVVVEPGVPYEVRQEGPDAVIVTPGGRLVLVGVRADTLPTDAVGRR